MSGAGAGRNGGAEAADLELVLDGEPPASARGALLMLHGRGSRAEEILALAGMLPREGFAFAAPRAPAGADSWYPYRFLEPLERNEPALSRSLSRVADSLAWLAAQGVGAERVILLGFSQGACLAAESAARSAGSAGPARSGAGRGVRYGGLAVLSGGLIGPPGPPGELASRYSGSLHGTPVFLGCSDVDPHIPLGRVHETARVFGGLGAEVTERVYPGLGHRVTGDEIEHIAAMMAAVRDGKAAAAG
jgi:phospholipase/carboxylesterase